MTKYRVKVQGLDSWNRRPDRQRFAQWERPANEPHPLVGAALLICLFAVATLLIVAFGG